MMHRGYEKDADDLGVGSNGFDSLDNLVEHFRFRPVVKTGRVHDVVIFAVDTRLFDLEFLCDLREINKEN